MTTLTDQGPRNHVEIMPDVTTPDEMRAEIFRFSRHNTIAHNCMMAADIRGLSGEDRYTILAYHALQAYARAMKLALDYCNSNVRPQSVIVTGKQP